jgi:TPP-dependent pyruvate/acetoin dehydrogenase alpha subunit
MYDPPEYVGWTPAPEVMQEYERTIKGDPERASIVRELSRDQLLSLYAGMVRFRLHDITLRRWVKQGVISKAWLGTGEEAVTIGAVHALDRRTDVIGPMIRNAGACHEMGISVADMLRFSHRRPQSQRHCSNHYSWIHCAGFRRSRVRFQAAGRTSGGADMGR